MNVDLLDPASFADGQPHEQFRWLRDNAPVYRHPEPDGPGFWAVTRYDDVRDVGRDPDHYSSVPTIMIPDFANIDFGGHQMMITSDPPHHTRLRRIINSQFTPRAAERLRLRIDELAAEIIDAVIERGECDAVTDIAGEMPSFVIAELLGIPLDDGRRLYHLTETIHAAPDSVPPGAGLNAIVEMFNYAHEVAEDKRAHPGDDLASRILGAEVDGERLDDIDFNLFFLLLIDAGGDTTRNLVGGGLVALFDHPHERRRLQDHLDAMLPTAVESKRMTAYFDARFRDPNAAVAAPTSAVVIDLAPGAGLRHVVIPPTTCPTLLIATPHGARPRTGRGADHGAPMSRVLVARLDSAGDVLLTGPAIRAVAARSRHVSLLVSPAGAAEWLPSNFISGPKHLPVRFTPARHATA